MRLRNDVARQAPAPVVIVTLSAGNIKLALATFEKFTPGIKKWLQSLVDGNPNGSSPRLVSDKRSEG
jgi:hypothetical protein